MTQIWVNRCFVGAIRRVAHQSISNSVHTRYPTHFHIIKDHLLSFEQCIRDEYQKRPIIAIIGLI